MRGLAPARCFGLPLGPMLRLCIAAALMIALSPARAEEGFVPGVPDLPLPPDLVAAADKVVVFDKPDGRIVEAEASGEMERLALFGWYRDVLPELGWRELPVASPIAALWEREGERLLLRYNQHSQPRLELRIQPLESPQE